MLFKNVAVLSVETIDAPHRIPSSKIAAQLAKTFERLEMRDDLLESVAGIKERRFWDEGVLPSEVAAQAAEKALKSSGVDRSKVGLLINTSVCRDYIEPSTASIVAGRLGMGPECMNYDIGNACLAFINGMDVAAMMLERNAIDYALIVDGEGSRQVTESTIERLNRPETTKADVRDQFASLTLGSGAVAMVMGRADEVDEPHRYKGGVGLAGTQHAGLCRGQIDHMITDTKQLLEAGLELSAMTWAKASKELGFCDDYFDLHVMHQISMVHTKMIADVLQIKLEKTHLIFPEFGNIGPASVPTVLAKCVEIGRVQKGSKISLMGIGSGINCIAAELVW